MEPTFLLVTASLVFLLYAKRVSSSGDARGQKIYCSNAPEKQMNSFHTTRVYSKSTGLPSGIIWRYYFRITHNDVKIKYIVLWRIE